MGMTSCINMNTPVLTIKKRDLGYRFLAGEAYWILTGDNRVDTIKPYSRSITNFSDDGETFFGAYGPKIENQLDYVVDCLCKDLYSRQAVINIWRENPPKSKDIPCTTTVQFLMREDKLHCILTMRSSDVWLGWPYDVFNFSMLSWLVLQRLYCSEEYRNDHRFSLGYLQLRAGSQHIYEPQFALASEIIREEALDEADSFKNTPCVGKATYNSWAKYPHVVDNQKDYHSYNIVDYLSKIKDLDLSTDGFLNNLMKEKYNLQ